MAHRTLPARRLGLIGQPERGVKFSVRAALAVGMWMGLTLGPIGAAWGQYKVVTPDGSVTYTDRAPADAAAKVQPMRREGSPAGPAAGAVSPAPTLQAQQAQLAQAALPFELRAVVARFPVTLYTRPDDCPPCLQARQWLVQRGVPFVERSVASDDDIAALQRLSGGSSVPALTIGGQALRGLQEQDWQTTLDLAGYPAVSRLPRGWRPAPATPLVARNTVNRSGTGDPLVIVGEPAAPVIPSVSPPPAAAAAASAGIRF